MFCKNCGAENKDTARFCNDCGGLILRAAPSRDAPPRQQPATPRESLVTRAQQPKATSAPLMERAPQTAARPLAKPQPAANLQPSAAPVPRRQPRVLTASAPETEPRARAATPERTPKVEMPKAEALKADIPKAAAPKVAVPKVETPKPRVEMPKPMAEMPKAAPKVEAPKNAAPPLQSSATPVKRTPRKMEIFEPSSPPPEPPRARPAPPERAQRLETFSPAMASSGDASITWPSVDASPMPATSDQLFSGKPRKPTARADAEKSTILIALAVVVIAVIAVSAGGYYLYTYEPAPPTPPNLQKLSEAYQREPPIQQQPVEEVSMVIPTLALSAPATEEGNALQVDSNTDTEIPDAPPAAGIVEPEIKVRPTTVKVTKPSPRVQPVQEIPADDPVINTATAPAQADENTKEKEDTKEEEPFTGYKVAFKVGFGQLVETRTYPSKQMRNRALELWTLEQKILEPDGTVNDKYVLKEDEFRPIPGH